jgi:ribosome-binding factor A
MLRVNELVKRELGLLCERDVAPQCDGLVTITRVEVTPDLRHATVFVSVFGAGDDGEARVFGLLKRLRRDWQRHLSKTVILKYTPVLRFEPDHTAENADRVFAILRELALPEEDGETTAD